MSLSLLKSLAASALAWLRTHPRVSAALALALAFVLGRVTKHSAAPSIKAQEKSVAVATSQEQKTAQASTQAQQRTQANTSETTDESKRVHVHKVERISASGDKTITTDYRSDDSLHVEEAQQVQVTFHFGALQIDSLTQSSTAAQSIEKTVTQTPAELPRFDLGALAGKSVRGDTLGAVNGGVRIIGPVWLQGEVLAGGGVGVAGLLGARVMW